MELGTEVEGLRTTVDELEEDKQSWIDYSKELRKNAEQANETIKKAEEACTLMGGQHNDMDEVDIPDEPE